jgi:hypothetical protein
MTTHTVELFETIILHPKDFPGQRNALAFFGAGARGIQIARRVAKTLKASGAVNPPTYLGGAQAELAIDCTRHYSTRTGWQDDSSAKFATSRWFHENRGALVMALDGDPRQRIGQILIFLSDKDFAARGTIRTVIDYMWGLCHEAEVLAAFDGVPEDKDWLAREVLSSIWNVRLWPTTRFRFEMEPQLSDTLLDYEAADIRDLSMIVKHKLNSITELIRAP